MKRVDNPEQRYGSPVRSISLSLLSFLLLFISITNEIPTLHNHSPIEACVTDEMHHGHCGEGETPLTLQNHIKEAEQCLFFHWNKISQSKAEQPATILTPLVYTQDEIVHYTQRIASVQTHSYYLRAPPYCA